MKKKVICCSWNSENRDIFLYFPKVVLNSLKEWCPGDYEKIYTLQMQTNTLILPSELSGIYLKNSFYWICQRAMSLFYCKQISLCIKATKGES